MQQSNRSSFSGKIGFILAAAGSAVGLGNIWRFPYLAAKYGGGIFLLVYILLAVTFGFTLMVSEISIGRKTGLSAVKAFSVLDKRFAFIGWLGLIVPAIIFPYYSVIGGWVTKYLFAYVTSGIAPEASETYFTTFISQPVQPLLWFAIFIGLTAAVVFLGVDKGVEKVSTIMMPILVVLTVIVAVYSMLLPGAMAGVKYYLLPDFSRFSIKTVIAALGQLFYSMSLAMGIMITYGSYMKKNVHVESSVGQIELFDTGIAFFAGLMIIPAVFAFSGGDETALGKGPSLMFITLPQVFGSMPGGRVIGIVFFLLVLFAALTSSISLMETVVSCCQDKFGWKRNTACTAVLIFSLLLGIPSSLGNGVWSDFKLLGMDFLSFCDFLSNNILMPVAAFATCIFIGFFLKPSAIAQEIEISGTFRRKKLYEVFVTWIAPVCILAILVSSILDTLGIWQL